MKQQAEFEVLLTKLRASRLSSDERRSTLDTLREEIVPHVTHIFGTPTAQKVSGHALFISAILDSPNDARRTVLQAISSHLEEAAANPAALEQAWTPAHELTKAIETFLRTTLKIQSSRSVSLNQSRTGIDVASLPTSTLRAMTAALKTLHALLRIMPKQQNSAGPSRSAHAKSNGLASLFDVLLPCFSAGLEQSTRRAPASIPRSQSSLQSGAFSWGEQPKRSVSSFNKDNTSITGPSTGNAIRIDHSSIDETDRKSDKSESERSDFSTVSTTSTRSRKDESRQQEATTKLIRQNSLHCFTELNRLESRALISRWTDLLPDQPAAAQPANGASTSTDRPALGRLSAFQSSAATSFSLCTIITGDSSTSVRIAAISALSSVLSHGTLQLSMAQERSQRALTFTSLSSQLAGWIVNIRSYLTLALQRAITGGGYPSSLAVALLGLVRTFVVATGKAKLLVGNESVLGPAVASLATNKDPEVQAAAKMTVAAMTAAIGRRQMSGSMPVATTNDRPSPAGVGVDMTALLGEDSELTVDLCERVLVALEAAADPLATLATWSVFVKSLAEAPATLLDPQRCARLKIAWRRLSTSQNRTTEQHCESSRRCRTFAEHFWHVQLWTGMHRLPFWTTCEPLVRMQTKPFELRRCACWDC